MTRDEKDVHHAFNISAAIGERHKNYTVIVETNAGTFLWRTNSKTWTRGAIHRLATEIDAKDFSDAMHLDPPAEKP